MDPVLRVWKENLARTEEEIVGKKLDRKEFENKHKKAIDNLEKVINEIKTLKTQNAADKIIKEKEKEGQTLEALKDKYERNIKEIENSIRTQKKRAQHFKSQIKKKTQASKSPLLELTDIPNIIQKKQVEKHAKKAVKKRTRKSTRHPSRSIKSKLLEATDTREGLIDLIMTELSHVRPDYDQRVALKQILNSETEEELRAIFEELLPRMVYRERERKNNTKIVSPSKAILQNCTQNTEKEAIDAVKQFMEISKSGNFREQKRAADVAADVIKRLLASKLISEKCTHALNQFITRQNIKKKSLLREKIAFRPAWSKGLEHRAKKHTDATRRNKFITNRL